MKIITGNDAIKAEQQRENRTVEQLQQGIKWQRKAKSN